MSVLLFIVAVALFAIVLFAVVEDNRQRVIISAVFAVVIVLGGTYAFINNSINQNRAEVIYAYEHDKTITCNGILVNKENFAYDYATQSFLGQNEHRGKTISLRDCTLQ